MFAQQIRCKSHFIFHQTLYTNISYIQMLSYLCRIRTRPLSKHIDHIYCLIISIVLSYLIISYHNQSTNVDALQIQILSYLCQITPDSLSKRIYHIGYLILSYRYQNTDIDTLHTQILSYLLFDNLRILIKSHLSYILSYLILSCSRSVIILLLSYLHMAMELITVVAVKFVFILQKLL